MTPEHDRAPTTALDCDAANKAFDIAFRGDTDGIDTAMAQLFARHRLAAEQSRPTPSPAMDREALLDAIPLGLVIDVAEREALIADILALTPVATPTAAPLADEARIVEQFNALADDFGFDHWPEGDDGEKTGDEQIAEVLEYGDYAEPLSRSGTYNYERVLLFAIKLGRSLATPTLDHAS